MRYLKKKDEMFSYITNRDMERAIRKNDLITMGGLLRKHGYVYFADMRLMHRAVNDENFKMIKVLIENGWDINQIDEYKENVLFGIIGCNENGWIKMYLIEKGIDVHQTARDGGTLLMEAARYDDFELGEIFVSRGISLTMKNMYGETVFNFLNKKNKTKWIDIFIKNQHHMDSESLKLLQKKRMELLFKA